MKPITSIIAVVLLAPIFFSQCRSNSEKTNADYPIMPLAFTRVTISDNFWKPRLETNRRITLPFALKKNEETGRVENFRKAAGIKTGAYEGRRFNDTDVFKVLEGAAYTLLLTPDPDLKKTVTELIQLIAAAQETDGYLYCARTVDPDNPAPGAGPERWSHLRGSHELYNAGHMYEAAVAHFQATGKRDFLDVAIKNANLLLDVFGPDKRRDFPGHEEIELGLAKLFRVSGNKKYLQLAKFFIEERGQKHDGQMYAEDTPFALYNRKAYMQDHLPVLQQTEAVGHAVRASYLYAGMADVAALGGYGEYISAINRLWEDVIGGKLYLTGGIGARHTTEAFGDRYELPNRSAYTETCAAIGNVFWNQRLFLLNGDSKYIDVLERVLYNGLISGVSLDGDRFFYQNPLESAGKAQRRPWFEVACCPGNITRFIPSIPGYVYSHTSDTIYVNLYTSNRASIILDGQQVNLEQETNYPWDGDITIKVSPDQDSRFTLMLRIPGWASGQPVPGDLYSYLDSQQQTIGLLLNGEEIPLNSSKGFAQISRTWHAGDQVSLKLPMKVRRVLAHPEVEANRSKVALERGPLVYCFEAIDNSDSVLDKTIPDEIEFNATFRPGLLGGVVVLQSNSNNHPLTAIPYYSWSHRGPGEMAVWLERKEKK